MGKEAVLERPVDGKHLLVLNQQAKAWTNPASPAADSITEACLAKSKTI